MPISILLAVKFEPIVSHHHATSVRCGHFGLVQNGGHLDCAASFGAKKDPRFRGDMSVLSPVSYGDFQVKPVRVRTALTLSI